VGDEEIANRGENRHFTIPAFFVPAARRKAQAAFAAAKTRPGRGLPEKGLPASQLSLTSSPS
jgi:hypothetical protein